MAGQVRVLQLEAGQELETKLFRLEKGNVHVPKKPPVLGRVSKLAANYISLLENWVTAKFDYLSLKGKNQFSAPQC